MKRTITCAMLSANTSYEIEIHTGIWNHLAERIAPLASRFAIITDERISELYGEPLRKVLFSYGLDVHLFSFPGGEKYKTRATKERLENQLFEKQLGRDTCVIGLGGGVVTDLAGYLAATYCRGVPLVMIPTSLLGMVDASIGGKTGVNVPYGKNLVGCLYPPKKVFIDPSFLKSLPQKELANGVVEMIKQGLVADQQLFEFLEKHADEILRVHSGGNDLLEQAIFESCRIKKEIVEHDEQENGKRRLLNFGHTVGHALETLTHYSLAHGEAVAIGLLVESRLSVSLGALHQRAFDRIEKILVKYGLPLQIPPQLSTDRIIKAMALDKKSLKGRPRFVVINDIGSPVAYDGNYCTHIDERLLFDALKGLCCIIHHRAGGSGGRPSSSFSILPPSNIQK